MLNLVATIIYLGAAASACAATACDSHSNSRRWLAIALIFVALAIWRLSGGEMIVQETVRRAASDHHLYGSRGELQRPLMALVLLLGVPSVMLTWRRLRRVGQGMAISIAQISTVVLVIYTFVRLVSLHLVDAFVYGSIGSIHVNYLIDGGLTLITLIAAAETVLRFAHEPLSARRAKKSLESEGS